MTEPFEHAFAGVGIIFAGLCGLFLIFIAFDIARTAIEDKYKRKYYVRPRIMIGPTDCG